MLRSTPALAGVGLAFLGAVAYAQPKPSAPVQPVVSAITPVAPSTLLKAPVDLGPQRPSAINQALSRAGLAPLTLPPPPAQIKLTPVQLVTTGGRITRIGQNQFVGPSAEQPDGMFAIVGGPVDAPPVRGPMFQLPREPTIARTGALEMELNVEPNRIYIVDCRGRQIMLNGYAPNPSITFSRASSAVPQRVAPEAEHFLYTFRSGSSPIERVELRFEYTLNFFGCEITKT